MKLAIAIIAGIIAVAGYYVGQFVSISVQMKVFDSLIPVAGIIFGITGAWIALLYPDALKQMRDPKSDNKSDLLRSVQLYLAPMACSAFVVGCTLTLMIGGTALQAMGPFEPTFWLSFARGVSFSLITTGAFAMVVSLFLALVPGINIEIDFFARHERHEHIKRSRPMSPSD